MTNKFPTASWLLPIGAENVHGSDDLDRNIMDIMDLYGISYSPYNYLRVKERIFHNFEHWYGSSNVTGYRICQLNAPQLVNVYNGQPATLTYDKWIGIPALQS